MIVLKNIRIGTLLILLFILLATALPIISAKLYANFSEDISDNVTMYSHASGNTATMTQSEYILGISLAQVDKNYSEEVLKALAVAMRSASLYLKGCCKELCYTDADYCDCESNLPFIKREEFIKNHSNSGNDIITSMVSAIDMTSNEFLLYKNSYALSLVHKSSYITTESSFDVFKREYPYLEPVITPEKPEISEAFIIESELVRRLGEYFQNISVSGIKASPTVKLNRAGRAETVNIFLQDIPASDFAEIFKVKSMNFEIEEVLGGFIIRSYGSGHGVGMSLAGSQKMAEEGLTYGEILLYYFKGCKIVDENENVY